jgi:hypothetical protein
MALKILITVHDQHLYEPSGIKELATIFALKNLMVLAFCFPPSLFAFSCILLL